MLRTLALDHTLVKSLPSFRSSTTSAYVLATSTVRKQRYKCFPVVSNAELINHQQVLVDGPSEKEEEAVPRHAAGLSHMSLTGIIIPNLPRGAGHAALKKQWDAYEVEGKWNSSPYAKSIEKSKRRRQLSDFERFKVMRLRKQVCVQPFSHAIGLAQCCVLQSIALSREGSQRPDFDTDNDSRPVSK